MDIWVSRCNKGCNCTYCGEPIEVGEAEVFGKLWLRFTSEGSAPRRWVKKFHWHARRKRDGQCCWLVAALAEFGKRVYVERRGRKRILLPKEDRDARLRLLRRRAKIIQQLRVEAEKSPEERNMEEMIRLGGILEQLKVDIAEVGGVPKSWEK